MFDKEFLDREGTNKIVQYFNSQFKKLSDNIDRRVQDKFDSIIGKNQNDGEVLDARKGERTLRNKIDKIDDLINLKANYIDLPYINIKSFGAKGDGTGNDTDAFDNALKFCSANSKYLYVPEGVYNVTGLLVPSNVSIYGSGMESTILRLISGGVKKNKSCVITNSDHSKGNENIHLFDMQLDWNFGNSYSTCAGSPGGSCLLFANCKNSSATRIYAKNPGMHCFDISNDIYNPNGKDPEQATFIRSNRSNNIVLDGCVGEGASDDCFTTHHSDNITIKNCVAKNPLGRVFDSEDYTEYNSNGYEIDDGSTNVSVESCYAYGGTCGFEVKAHNYAPAPSNINLSNCYAIGNSTSFQVRHIGFENTKSTTAKNVNINNCYAINPGDTNLANSNFRALRMFAYDCVNVNNFTAIGDGRFLNKLDDDVIRLTSNLTNVNLSNINISGFENASNDIYVTSSTKNINVNNLTITNSSAYGVRCTCSSFNLIGANINRENVGSIGIWTNNPTASVIGCIVNGFENNGRINGSNYDDIPKVN